MVTIERLFPVDHPAAQGHFPGNPIIPGAVLLSETLQAIEANLKLNLSPLHIGSAKFLHPARPGDRIRIEFSEPVAGAIKFTCAVGPTPVMTGTAICGALSTPA